MRALAVLAVMAYHGGVGWASGGFLGVDAFFVLSGYLITSLLVTERGATGTIALKSFWARRARRLLPALLLVVAFVVIAGCVSTAFYPLARLRADVFSTLAYVANWHQIWGGQGYFAQTSPPSPLLHTWSLAIEEQFYIVWPPVVLAVLTLWRSTRVLLAVALSGAVASAVAMVELYRPGEDTARLYYGTDTRAQAILIGAVLALVLLRRDPERVAGRWAAWLGAAGLGALVWEMVNLDGAASLLYRGGFALASVATAVLIGGVVLRGRGLLAGALSLAPVRYLGRISYGLYLWHWPVYLAMTGARTGLTGPALLGVRFAATTVVAAASFHLVEQPLRRGRVAYRWPPHVPSKAEEVPLSPARGGWPRTWVAAGAGALSVLVATLLVFPAPSASGAGGSSASVSGARGSSLAGAAGREALGARAPAAPVRILLEGDSMAWSLALGIQDLAPRYGAVLYPEGVISCGLTTEGEVRDKGVAKSQAVGDAGVPCAGWPDRWRQQVASYRPQVAALLVGPWEVRDHLIGGRWVHLGQPSFDDYERAQLQQAVDILSSQGAAVALLTSPYYSQGESLQGTPWPEDDPARVDRLNQVIREVAAANPGRATVIELGAQISPGGYKTSVDGVTVRWADGLHISVEGDEWLAPTLFPQLLRLAPGRNAPGHVEPPLS